MTIKSSDALENRNFDTDDLAFYLNSGFIFVFSGTEPATADTALDVPGTHALLLKYSSVTPAQVDGVTGLTFAAAAASRALSKEPTETWTGEIGASGTASFFRFCAAGDNGQAAGGATTYRIQGTCGPAGDLLMADPVLVATNARTIANMQLRR